MTPRAFLFTTAPPQNSFQTYMQKDQSVQRRPGLRPLNNMEHSESINTVPVMIPPKRTPRTSVRREARSRTQTKALESSRRSSSSSSNDRSIPTSVVSMLDATAIPVPRRNWPIRRSRKLPRVNHVEEFSRMMQEGFDTKEDCLMGGVGNSPLDILLSPPDDEDQEKYTAGNDSELETPFSSRSVSSDSMPSLSHDLDSPPNPQLPPTPTSQKSPTERRQLRYSPSEDCALDHPLLEPDDEECGFLELESNDEPNMHDTAPAKRPASFRSFPRLRSSFRSNLTASLRAIKSAAQSVSAFATPSVQPEDFLTRSFFTITPELTDDRRPPPMQTPPSPALRRYLNPTPISAAEMYVYLDHPHETPQSSQTCPVSIQMQTYRRSRGRGHRRNHFHVVPSKNRDHYYTFDPEVPPMSRQREPRENSDFLRMVVLEMNMRRRGKLRDDIPPRARIMLPPRKSNPYRLSGDYEEGDDNDAIPSRWVGVSP